MDRGSSSSCEVAAIVGEPASGKNHITTQTLDDLLKFKRHKAPHGKRNRPLFQSIGLQNPGKFDWWPPSYRASRHTDGLKLVRFTYWSSNSVAWCPRNLHLAIANFVIYSLPNSSQSQWPPRTKLPISDEYSNSSFYA